MSTAKFLKISTNSDSVSEVGHLCTLIWGCVGARHGLHTGDPSLWRGSSAVWSRLGNTVGHPKTRRDWDRNPGFGADVPWRFLSRFQTSFYRGLWSKGSKVGNLGCLLCRVGYCETMKILKWSCATLLVMLQDSSIFCFLNGTPPAKEGTEMSQRTA